MYELRCPWQTVTTQTQERSYLSTTKIEFGKCIKGQCPFWHPETEIGYCNTVPEYCMRVKGEKNA